MQWIQNSAILKKGLRAHYLGTIFTERRKNNLPGIVCTMYF